jgi:hypothetical protein
MPVFHVGGARSQILRFYVEICYYSDSLGEMIGSDTWVGALKLCLCS